MSQADPHASELASEDWLKWEPVLKRFERAWEEGTRPAIDDYLPAGGLERGAALIELVHTDLEYRLKAGEAARVEEYLLRYPEVRRDRTTVLELIAAEHAFRRRREPALAREEYFARFPDYREELTARLPPAEAGLRARADPQGQPQADGDLTPTVRDLSPTATAGPTRATPRIAGYEVLGELGRGGMGVVYKARQLNLNRLVALKMVRAGVHAGPEELGRIRAEAEAAAMLQHAHIVQIHEIGEHARLPYLSLEYVDGGSLALKLAGTPLPPSQAAELVQTLARAVHYAHQRGVVHRDLKPANVLLTADGTPKITDFGLAKRLEAEAGLTRTGEVMGTPSYMAPEQAAGRTCDVGPASDVYALGAILYESLTGRPPFRAATVPDTLEQVRYEEPVPPRRLQPKLPRDLETIALKCLQKERSRRYGSAEALADDVRHFLGGEPILARPVGRIERLFRWCRRKPVVASLSAALLVVCVGGFAGVTWQLLRAEREWDRAEKNLKESEQQTQRALEAEARATRRFQQVREMARTFIFDFHDKIRNLPGSTEARKTLVETGLTYLDNLNQDAQDDVGVLRELGAGYAKMGDVLGNPNAPNLGDTVGALASYRKGLAIYASLAQADPGNLDTQRHLSSLYMRVGDVQALQGRSHEALGSYGRSLEIMKAVAKSDLNNLPVQRELYLSMGRVGRIQRLLGQAGESLATTRTALEIIETLAKKYPSNALIAHDLSHGHFALGEVHRAAEQWDAALASFQKALEIQDTLVKANANHVMYRRDQAASYSNIGQVQQRLGQTSEALASYRKALEIAEALAAADPRNAAAQEDRAASYAKLGDIQVAGGGVAEALASYRKALEITQALAKADPRNARTQQYLGVGHRKVGRMQAALGQTAEALASFQKDYEIHKVLVKADPDKVDARRGLAISQHRLGATHAQIGADTMRTQADRSEHLRQARDWYNRSRETYLAMKERGILAASDADMPNRLAKEIARCDAAIAELQKE